MKNIRTFLALWAMAIPAAGIADMQTLLQNTQAHDAHVLLVMGDETVSAAAKGPLVPGGRLVTADDVFLTASVGKLYLAVALLEMDALGLLDIDAPVATYLPAKLTADLGGLQDVTTAHLLTMTSGLPDYLDQAFVERDIAGPVTPEQAMAHIAGEKALFRPGQRFDYSNTNYVLAHMIAAGVGGSLPVVLETHVFARMGDRNSFVVGRKPRPANMAFHLRGAGAYYDDLGFGDGAIVTTAGQTAQFYRALFHDRSLLGAEHLARLLHDPVGAGYGMGIVVERDPDLGLIYGHSGGDLGYAADVKFRVATGEVAVYLTTDEEADLNVTYDALIETCASC